MQQPRVCIHLLTLQNLLQKCVLFEYRECVTKQRSSRSGAFHKDLVMLNSQSMQQTTHCWCGCHIICHISHCFLVFTCIGKGHTWQVICNVLWTLNVKDIKAELLKELKPLGLPSWQVCLLSQVCECSMICKNIEFFPYQKVPPPFQCKFDSHKLPLCGWVVAFSTAQPLGHELNWKPVVVHKLLQHRTTAICWCITDHPWSGIMIKDLQHGGTAQHILQHLECFLLFFSPLKAYILTCQICERGSKLTKSQNELSIIIAQPQEWLYLN